jgi:hypothetical protein
MESIDSFSIAWQALEPAARLLLQAAGRWFNPNALVEAELVAALAPSFQEEGVVRVAVDACRDLYLLQGEGRLTMRSLLVRFVDRQPPQRLAGIGAEDLAPVVAAAMGKAAERLEEAPADWEALAALQCHQLGWEFWRQLPSIRQSPGSWATPCGAVSSAAFCRIRGDGGKRTGGDHRGCMCSLDRSALHRRLAREAPAKPISAFLWDPRGKEV